jgi:hypothetical protein
MDIRTIRGDAQKLLLNPFLMTTSSCFVYEIHLCEELLRPFYLVL